MLPSDGLKVCRKHVRLVSRDQSATLRDILVFRYLLLYILENKNSVRTKLWWFTIKKNAASKVEILEFCGHL